MADDTSTNESAEDQPQQVDGVVSEKHEASKDDKRPTMHIKVYGPFAVYVDEDGYSISGVNATGPFDILPRHHNFISILESCELVVETPYETKKIKISRGVMHVRADKVIVFLDV